LNILVDLGECCRALSLFLRPIDAGFAGAHTDLPAKNRSSDARITAMSEPRELTAQQQREIRARRKEGEPADSVARAYNIDIDAVRRLAG
jgi:hypothetical protein